MGEILFEMIFCDLDWLWNIRRGFVELIIEWLSLGFRTMSFVELLNDWGWGYVLESWVLLNSIELLVWFLWNLIWFDLILILFDWYFFSHEYVEWFYNLKLMIELSLNNNNNDNNNIFSTCKYLFKNLLS